MRGQGALFRETLPAVITFVRLALSSVGPLMRVHAALLREMLPAVVTFIRLLSSVGTSHVCACGPSLRNAARSSRICMASLQCGSFHDGAGRSSKLAKPLPQ